jgi:hypothetical protein
MLQSPLVEPALTRAGRASGSAGRRVLTQAAPQKAGLARWLGAGSALFLLTPCGAGCPHPVKKFLKPRSEV